MTNTAYPILCGGTFFSQILESRKTTTTRRNRTQGKSDAFLEQDVLLGLVKIVQPDYVKPAGNTFGTYTTHFKKCSVNTPRDLQFVDDAVVSAFLSRLKSNYSDVLNEMTGLVNDYIEVGTTSKKDVKLASRLIDMVINDVGKPPIPDDYGFAIREDGSTVFQKDLSTVTDIYLPAFLLSIWKYVVTNRKDNTVGSETVDNWTHRDVQGRYLIPDGITANEDLRVNCGSYVPPKKPYLAEGVLEGTTSNLTQDFLMPDVYKYLRNAEAKYSTMKTLLYNDEPKLFYSFYVCNRILTRSYHEDEDVLSVFVGKRRLLEDVTVEKIREISRYAIIIGTGGLGKSMMMRHLMLNAIANFDDLKRFPVFVPLKDFDETQESLIDYIFSRIGIFDKTISFEQFEQMLIHGVCLLLLDGLDEIGAGSITRFEREIEALTDKYSGNMFVLSSRPDQLFISYDRFTLLKLMPFNSRQAMQLIDRLEFRPDEPAIKEKFLSVLEKTLFQTHKSFTENPLLLTIMLLTFEQYAEVPSKMHIFYREAFEVLAKRHDASKGAYKRALRTGLSVDTFSDYFAELCFRSYNDEKFELTAEEFDGYFNQLNTRVMANDKKSKASDFREDLCSNLCLMYVEGNSYHFTHRSFQEYFTALFFSKQKDKFIVKLGEFFEKHQRRMFSDRTFLMLYDMVPDKVEEFIFLPFLQTLYERCDKAEGYWTFLKEMYPSITYSSERDRRFLHRVIYPQSFRLSSILDIVGFYDLRNSVRDMETIAALPYYEELEIESIPRLKQIAYINDHGEEEYDEVVDDEAGYICKFFISEILKDSDYYNELLTDINDDNFIFKKQFNALRLYMNELLEKQKTEDDSLFDLL